MMLTPANVRFAPGLTRSVEILRDHDVDPSVIEKVSAEWHDMIAATDRFYNEGPAIIHSIDAEGRLIAVSDQWLERFGFSREEVIGRYSTEFLTPASAKVAREHILPKVMQTGTCQDVHYQYVAKSGEILDVLLSAFAIRDEHGEYYRSFAILQDISEIAKQKRRLEEEIERRERAEAIAQSKMRQLSAANLALEQYSYASAHDIRSPIRNINSLVQMTLEDHGGAVPALVANNLKLILRQADRIETLLDSMAEYSRLSISNVTTESFNLRRAVDSALVKLAPEIAETNAEITVGELPVVHANLGFMTKLFQNLIANSLRYRNGNPVIHVSANRNHGAYEISVRDRGPGIEAIYRDRIFEPLRRLHNHYDVPGSGLGLAICRRIVEMHEGSVWLNTDYQYGADFRVSLPVPSIEGDTVAQQQALHPERKSEPGPTPQVAEAHASL